MSDNDVLSLDNEDKNLGCMKLPLDSREVVHRVLLSSIDVQSVLCDFMTFLVCTVSADYRIDSIKGQIERKKRF